MVGGGGTLKKLGGGEEFGRFEALQDKEEQLEALVRSGSPNVVEAGAVSQQNAKKVFWAVQEVGLAKHRAGSVQRWRKPTWRTSRGR
jgi:hypothetical protein